MTEPRPRDQTIRKGSIKDLQINNYRLPWFRDKNKKRKSDTENMYLKGLRISTLFYLP